MNDGNRPPFGTSTVVCSIHGLRFDPSLSSGCIRCRAVGVPAPSGAPRRAIVFAAVGFVAAAVGVVVVQQVPGAPFSMPFSRHPPVVIPIPNRDAVPEALPNAGAESVALGEARSHIDVYELDAARRVLAGVLLRNPQSGIAHAYLARLEYRAGQKTDGTCDAVAVARAEQELAKADALAPGLPDTKLARAFLRLFAGDMAGAREAALDVEREGSLAQRASYLVAHVEVVGNSASPAEIADAERRATAIIEATRDGFLLTIAYGVLDDVFRLRGDERARYALEQYLTEQHARDSRGRPR